jgi:hypothetical protein
MKKFWVVQDKQHTHGLSVHTNVNIWLVETTEISPHVLFQVTTT